MDPITIILLIGPVLVGAFLIIELLLDLRRIARDNDAAPFARGYSSTRPPNSLVPPSAEASQSPITPLQRRSDYLDVVIGEGFKPVQPRPFTGEDDIQRQIKRFIKESRDA